MEYRNGTCGVDNNTRSKGRHAHDLYNYTKGEISEESHGY